MHYEIKELRESSTRPAVVFGLGRTSTEAMAQRHDVSRMPGHKRGGGAVGTKVALLRPAIPAFGENGTPES
jgi:hypothetical protein